MWQVQAQGKVPPCLVQVQTLLARAIIRLLDKQDFVRAQIQLLLNTAVDPANALCLGLFHQHALQL